MGVEGNLGRAGRCNVLVLTRRSEESIVIGGNIIVTILSVEGEKVRLGIEAPREIAVLRKELVDVIQQQNQLAKKLASIPESPAFQGLRDMLVGSTVEMKPSPPPE
jgi:carbon storage regulator